MKTSLRRMISVGALGLALTLSSCVYPYNYAGSYQPRSTLYGSIGGGPLGSFAGSRLATNRGQSYNGYNSRYYSVRGAPLYSSRGYTPYRSSYSPYRSSSYSRGYGYSPYSYGYSPFSGGYSPFNGIMLSSYNFGTPSYGYGRGWGYGSSCW